MRARGGEPSTRPRELPGAAPAPPAPPGPALRSTARHPPIPVAFDPGCWLCPALALNRRRVVPGYGAAPAAIAWIGEAPGRHGADRTGVPFTGDKSGRRLMALLIRLGLSAETDPRCEAPRLACLVTNLVRCNPPGNRTPTAREIERCQLFLQAELEAARPAVIVALGLPATRFALASFLGWRAERIAPLHARPVAVPGRSWPQILVPSRHPSRASNADWRRLERAVAGCLPG